MNPDDFTTTTPPRKGQSPMILAGVGGRNFHAQRRFVIVLQIADQFDRIGLWLLTGPRDVPWGTISGWVSRLYNEGYIEPVVAGPGGEKMLARRYNAQVLKANPDLAGLRLNYSERTRRSRKLVEYKSVIYRRTATWPKFMKRWHAHLRSELNCASLKLPFGGRHDT